MPSRLRRAVERDELVLHYQPLVELEGGRTVGVEALIRWQRPRRGSSARGVRAGRRARRVIGADHGVGGREACEQSRTWRDAGIDLFVSVNLPPVFWSPT